MELVSLAKELLQNLAEQGASYKIGQSALRQLDRGLWIVEKSAKWAVPPPLDQDERPQPELVRPLPWVFFLTLLVLLRVARESISLVNLVLGKPPLRAGDVVMYIQSKRRYLRTLKYQGSRMMRARSIPTQSHESWMDSVRSLFEFTFCFKRQSHYGNNNTTRISNNDEILVIKHSKSGSTDTSPVPSSSEATMERLIEKMMVDLNADSDDDSSFTLTNVTNGKTDESETESETTYNDASSAQNANSDIDYNSLRSNDSVERTSPHETSDTEPEQNGSVDIETAIEADDINTTITEDTEEICPKKVTENFIQQEIKTVQLNERKIGRKIKNWSLITNSIKKFFNENKTFGGRVERFDGDIPVVRIQDSL